MSSNDDDDDNDTVRLSVASAKKLDSEDSKGTQINHFVIVRELSKAEEREREREREMFRDTVCKNNSPFILYYGSGLPSKSSCDVEIVTVFESFGGANFLKLCV